MQFLHRFRLRIALLLTLSILACHPVPRPAQGPDATVSTPSDVGSTAETIFSYASWALPAIDIVVSLLPIPEPVKALIHGGIAVAQQTVLRLHTAVDTYRARHGGDARCELYASAGAVRDALFIVVDQIASAGYQPPVDIRTLVGSIGGLLDEALNDTTSHCADDAGLRAPSGNAGVARLDRVVDVARSRGVVLRPFPPVHQ